MTFTDPWFVGLAAGGFSFTLCLLLSSVANRMGWLDNPGSHKTHTTAIPQIGGVAIYLAMAIVLVLATQLQSDLLMLLLACGLLMIAGLVDDTRELSPFVRFILQILACSIMIFAGDVVLTDFGLLMWNGLFSLGWLSVPVTIFAALGVINAFNMVDGMDGLSSGIFLIACAALIWFAQQAGQTTNAILLVIAMGAVFGFFLLNARLPWNRGARLYLGDSGSVFLGLFLAWQLIDLGNGEDRAFVPMTAVWLLGIPLLDTTRLMTQRWRAGGSALAADQFHLHHAFLKSGFSVVQTWFAIMGLALFTTFVGLAGHILAWPDYLMFYGYLVFCLVYLRVMHRCWHDGRFLGRDVSSDVL